MVLTSAAAMEGCTARHVTRRARADGFTSTQTTDTERRVRTWEHCQVGGWGGSSFGAPILRSPPTESLAPSGPVAPVRSVPATDSVSSVWSRPEGGTHTQKSLWESGGRRAKRLGLKGKFRPAVAFVCIDVCCYLVPVRGGVPR